MTKITRIVTKNVSTSCMKVKPKALLCQISLIFLKRRCFFISPRLWKDDIGPKFPVRRENVNVESYFDLEFWDHIVTVGWTIKGQMCCSVLTELISNWWQRVDMSRQSVDSSCIEGFPWSLSWGHIPIFSHILSHSLQTAPVPPWGCSLMHLASLLSLSSTSSSSFPL